MYIHIPTNPQLSIYQYHLSNPQACHFNVNLEVLLREAPFNLSPPPCGHCPNSIYTPPPPHLNGNFFQAQFYHFYHFFYHFL